ncbi:MAG: bifunctional UDP-N-acetylglucosamine diphosphorylase/glucosamine-1-phosphate N-acetyltransferase GlmU [Candidatus Nanopelagicales bacterium]|nr:bifunctional UDP-N-acetylglucosamine diphosphorylase/glucosamine-1-phosphate N-acetyltransferase GlmU [Candidatus Nanopelagicales bacterium]
MTLPGGTSPAEPLEIAPSAVIVLAAGEGTRMKSGTAKVLHEICGRSLVGHVIAAVEQLRPGKTVVVIGHQRDRVAAHLAEEWPEVLPVVQAEQNGTGHAVRMALRQMDAEDIDWSGGPVVVVSGDSPLLKPATLRLLVNEQVNTGAAVTVLSAVVADPSGYGRVIRAGDGSLTAIVEDRDADVGTLAIDEVNSAMYSFDPEFLRSAISRLSTKNAQGEEYLPDLVAIARHDGLRVSAIAAADAADITGVNDRAQMAQAAAVLRSRINEAWMAQGVTMTDPARTYVDVTVELEADATLEPGVILRGSTKVGAGAIVGPDCTLVDTVVESGAHVNRVHAVGAAIGPRAEVGPFTFLRPGARIEQGAKAGAYVEIKNAVIGPGAKVPHLTYVGDATIGAGTNIGAATIFVNYDGVDKHHTTVGRDVRIGSDTMLVAPLTIGDGAYTAAGSVITEDVPAGALAVARGRQRNIEGWVEKRRPGSPAAEAARGSDEEVEP